MIKKIFFYFCALIAVLIFPANVANAQTEQAYVELTDAQTLTFKYGVKPQDGGTYYDFIPFTLNPDWATDANKQAVTTVVFDESFKNVMPTSCFAWFKDLSALQTITDIKYLNTSNVNDMYAMFRGCTSLTDLDVSNFNTARVTNMEFMFYDCSNLTELDLSCFNTASVTVMECMFYDCSKLETIKVGSGWNTDAVGNSEYMFYDCSNLVGGNGTKYQDVQVDDGSYAHIDGGPDNPGYLTAGNEPYVVYDSDVKSLTFKYGVRPTTAGEEYTFYSLNTGQNVPQWIEEHSADIKSVTFNDSFQQARPTTCYSWFAGCTNLTEITGMKERLNTEKVEDMSKMFYNCQNLGRGTNYLAKINVANFKTDNVTSMDEMFSGCSKVTSLDLCSFSFSSGKLNSVKKMFAGCSNLQTIYVSDNWVLPSAINATNSEDMFDGCTVLKGSSGTEYSTAGVKDATYAHADGGTSNPGYFSKGGYYVFYDNETLIFKFGDRSSDIINPSYNFTYDIPTDGSMPSWNTLTGAIHHIVFDKSFDGARPTNCKKWFQNFSKLESLSGMQYFHTDNVTSMENMFHNCENLQSIDLGYFTTSQVTDMAYMFCGCKKITVLNLKTFNTSAVTAMNNMFVGMEELRAIYVDEWVISNTTTTTEMFGSNKKLVGGLGTTFVETNDNGTYAKIDGGTSSPGYFTNVNKYGYAVLNNGTLTFKKGSVPDNLQGTVFELVPFTEKRVTSNGTFYYEHPAWQAHCGEINNVVFENGFHDVDVRTCHEWFQGCTNLTSITGFANLNTSNVTDMSFMFFGCENLTTIDLVGLNTENVTNFKTMFSGCKNLSTIGNISSLKTTNGVDFSSMFQDCENLESIDITGFNTANGTQFASMFQNCKKLETVNVSQMRFKSSDVTVGEMFMGCSGLTSIDISEWATLKNFQNLFLGCSSLTSVTVGNIVTETTEDIHGMFEGCSSLDDEAMANAIGYFNTSKVEDMANLFKDCTSLTVLDISHFNTESVVSIQKMFANCTNLTTIKVGDGWSINVNNIQWDYEKMDIFYNDISVIGNDGTVCDVTKYPNFVDVDYAKADDGGLLSSGKYKIFYDLDADDGQIILKTVADAPTDYEGGSEVSLPTLPESDERGEFLGWMRTSQDASGNVVLGSSTMTISAGETGNRIYSAKWALTKEKYVYYENSTKTLYFKFAVKEPGDNVYDLNEGEYEPGWLEHKEDIENVVFETTLKPSTCYKWFAGCSKLKALDLTNIKTDNLTNTKSMFYGCTNLTAILVDDTQWERTYIDANVTESDNMFAGCTSLIGNYGNWISNSYLDKTFAVAVDPYYYQDAYLTSGNYKIFYDLDDGELNGESYYYTQEYSADVELGIPTQEGYIFLGWARETSNGVFSDPSTTVTVAKNSGNYKFKAVWGEPYAVYSEEGDDKILTFKVGDKDSETSDDIYDLNTGDNPGWVEDSKNAVINKVVFDESFQYARPTTCSKWFFSMTNLKEIVGLTNLNTSEVTIMGSMFTGCEKLTVLDLSSFSFSSTAASLKTNDMFEACTNLTTIIVGEGWDNTKITGTSENMFNGCSALIGNYGAKVGTSVVDKTYAYATASDGNKNGYLTTGKYKIFYNGIDDDDETLDTYDDAVTEFFNEEVTLKEPTKTDYTFDGWTGTGITGLAEKTKPVTIGADEVGNRIYTAHWTATPHEINLPTGWTAYAADDLDTPITSATAGTEIVVQYTGTTPIKKVEVFPMPKSITITQANPLTMSVDDKEQLTYTIAPDGVLDEDKNAVTWSSSEETVATVSADGIVEAKGTGETIITAETVNGVTATIKVIVE